MLDAQNASPSAATNDAAETTRARDHAELEVFRAFGAFPGLRIFNRLAAIAFVGGAGYLLFLAVTLGGGA